MWSFGFSSTVLGRVHGSLDSVFASGMAPMRKSLRPPPGFVEINPNISVRTRPFMAAISA